MANLSTHVIRSNIIFIQNNICRYIISTSPIPAFPQTFDKLSVHCSYNISGNTGM